MSNQQHKTQVSGVILIDKPQGFTSQQVVSKVKYLFKSPLHNSKKAGHTGTLDPMATGLLPVCLGEATKFSHYQLDADKHYTATLALGVQTDTGDAEGKVIATQPVPEITSQQIQKVTEAFTGGIWQTPPMYSALKKDGKKLYEYAREGIEVERPARPITIKALTLSLDSTNQSMHISVSCSKGTYIRVLGEDIAKSLGTLGHLSALRRTQVGDFVVTDAIGLNDLEKSAFENRFDLLLDIDACIETLPKLLVSAEQGRRLRLGQRLNIFQQLQESSDEQLGSLLHNEEQYPNGIEVRIFDTEDAFIGLATVEASGRLQPKKMIQR